VAPEDHACKIVCHNIDRSSLRSRSGRYRPPDFSSVAAIVNGEESPSTVVDYGRPAPRQKGRLTLYGKATSVELMTSIVLAAALLLKKQSTSRSVSSGIRLRALMSNHSLRAGLIAAPQD
jgi:hypothetical protein